MLCGPTEDECLHDEAKPNKVCCVAQSIGDVMPARGRGAPRWTLSSRAARSPRTEHAGEEATRREKDERREKERTKCVGEERG